AVSMVDVKTVSQQKALNESLLESLASGTKGWGTLSTVVPGLNYSAGMTSFTGTGGVYNENNPSRQTGGSLSSYHAKIGVTTMYDGMITNAIAPQGQQGYFSNPYTAEEMRLQTSVSADTKISGISYDMIPKEGSNSFHGVIFGQDTGPGLQSSNLTDALKQR